MKKIVLIIIITCFGMAIIYAAPAAVTEKRHLLENNNTSLYSLLKYYKLSEEKFNKADTLMRKIHPVFAGISYAGFWGLTGIGIALTVMAFNDCVCPYYTGLQIAQLAVAVPTILSFGTMLGLGYTKMGLKLQAGHALRKKHFIASFVTLAFYVAELVTLIVSSVFHFNNMQYRKWVGLEHNIVGTLTLAAFTVSLITIFF